MSFKSVYAINGLNLNSHKKTNKELEIEFISSIENPQHYELKFRLIHINLNSNSASFFINDESNDLSVILINSDKLNLGRSDRSTFTTKISKNEIPNSKISQMSFKAFLLCDGLAAETKKFKITNKTEVAKDDSITVEGIKYNYAEIKKELKLLKRN